MAVNKGMFTSEKDDWETPQWLFDKLNEEFSFTLDVAANISNHKTLRYFDKTDNGLKQDWKTGICWMNPPYGNEIGKWIKKASEEGMITTIVCLLPARTDTKWFHDYVMKADEIRFIKGRLKFGNQKNSAPFPSMVVIFRPIFEKKFDLNVPVITRYNNGQT